MKQPASTPVVGKAAPAKTVKHVPSSSNLKSAAGKGKEKETVTEEEREGEAFWEYDEGLEELSKGVKDA